MIFVFPSAITFIRIFLEKPVYLQGKKNSPKIRQILTFLKQTKISFRIQSQMFLF